MTQIILMKVSGGLLAPVDQQAIDYISKMKLGAGVTVDVKRHRNPGFHKKFFALLNLAFEAWEPGERAYQGELVRKNFEQFRNDITVLAGYFDMAITLKGETRLTAKSISFASMGQDEFEELYNAVINVVLQKILTNYSRDDLDNVVNQILGFT